MFYVWCLLNSSIYSWKFKCVLHNILFIVGNFMVVSIVRYTDTIRDTIRFWGLAIRIACVYWFSSELHFNRLYRIMNHLYRSHESLNCDFSVDYFELWSLPSCRIKAYYSKYGSTLYFHVIDYVEEDEHLYFIIFWLIIWYIPYVFHFWLIFLCVCIVWYIRRYDSLVKK